MAYAVGKIHVEIVRLSLEQDHRTCKPEDSFAAMMRAALIGNTGAVRAFLGRGVGVNDRDGSGRTPLMEAVFGGHIDTIGELLERDADVNAQDRDGWTALMEAASKGRVEIVRLLLSHEADPRIKNSRGLTALKATAKCNTEVTRLLKDAVQ